MLAADSLEGIRCTDLEHATKCFLELNLGNAAGFHDTEPNQLLGLHAESLLTLQFNSLLHCGYRYVSNGFDGGVVSLAKDKWIISSNSNHRG